MSKSAKDGHAQNEQVKRFRARVYVSFKPTVNDPEGLTIAGALASLGFEGIESVRSGRYFEVTLDAGSDRKAEKAVDQMCQRLLANPVIEQYTFRVNAL